MKIEFHGAARTVTGSQHLLNLNGRRLLLECGLFQGRRKEAYNINKNLPFDPGNVDAMVLSHAHIDHSGNIPNLTSNGFRGHIYTTKATMDLCGIMLRDSAYLQEKDIQYVNKIRAKKGKNPFEPVYTIEQAEAAMQHFVGLPYDRAYELLPGVRVTFRDAGHILGSAGVLLEITENGRSLRFGFTGDIGREDVPILRDPNRLRDLDVLIMESTYGDRLHKPRGDVEEELARLVRETAKRGGKVIIPAFAVGRTQTLVYILHKLFDQNRIPDIPIFVDSPLACKATDIYRIHPECFDRETRRVFLRDEEDPFGFSRLTAVRETDKSKELNELAGPAVIISASGMAEGGRILHHLKNNIGKRENLLLFVGYAASYTLARKIMDGAKEVRIFDETYRVKAQVHSMDAFSGHADRDEMLQYLEAIPPKRLKHLFLVHGEEDQALPFRERLLNKGYRNVHFPESGEVFEV